MRDVTFPYITQGAILIKPLTVSLILSVIGFGLLANHSFIIARNNDLALLYGAVAAVQMMILLTQADLQQMLARSGINPLPLSGFRQSRRRQLGIVVGLLWMALTHRLAWGGEFTVGLLIVWLTGITWWWQLLQEERRRYKFLPFTISVNTHILLILAMMLIGTGILLYQIDDIPRGMTPDHAEKVFDLVRLEDGLTSTYFGANSGREPLHFYLAYAISQFSGYNFLGLKLASVLYGILMLPTLYILGRQVNGKLTGLLTMAIGALSVWQIVHARSGFRAWSAAVMAALLVLALWRAIHSGKRIDFLWAGAALGVGQYTYTAFRMMPLLVVIALGLRYLVDRRSWRKLLVNALTTFAIAAMIFMPLLSYWMHFPSAFWRRSTNMIGADFAESLRLVINGLYESIMVFNFTTDPVQLNVIPDWPALGPTAGALFLMGFVYWLWRIVQNRRWLELLLPSALFVAILPSALGISSPNEMPSTRRAVIAFPLVMLFAGIFLSLAAREVAQLRPRWLLRPVTFIACSSILYLQIAVNWTAYSGDYFNRHSPSTEAQIQVANEIEHFLHLGGTIDRAFLVFDKRFVWVNARIIAIRLGETTWHNVILTDEEEPSYYLCNPPSEDEQQPLLFLYAVGMTEEYIEAQLKDCYPEHTLYSYSSDIAGRMFNVFYVPALLDRVRID